MNTFIRITSNGGYIGRIHWINGDLSQSDQERIERYLANKYGIVQHLFYGQPVIPRFGRVWWGDGSDHLNPPPSPNHGHFNNRHAPVQVADGEVAELVVFVAQR